MSPEPTAPEGFESKSVHDCPHCGGKASWKLTYTRSGYGGRDDGYAQWHISCNDCQIGTRQAINKEQFREQFYFWNRRLTDNERN